MKLTSMLYRIIKDVKTSVSLSFWLEGDDYTIKLEPGSRSDFEYKSTNSSVSTQDIYKSARIVELWTPGAFTLYYVDEVNDNWFELNLRRNNIPIRLYGRSRLFFNK